MDPSPPPNPPRGGRMVAICDGDVRRATVTEHRLLNALMSERYVGTNAISPNLEYRSTDETVPGSMGSNKT
eukprot:scaffold21272_cov131-Skeletonema_menzelii.AAC.1